MVKLQDILIELKKNQSEKKKEKYLKIFLEKFEAIWKYIGSIWEELRKDLEQTLSK